MIEPIVVRHNDREYELTIDADAPMASCWHWSEVGTNMQPASAIREQLSRVFIEQHAASVVQQLVQKVKAEPAAADSEQYYRRLIPELQRFGSTLRSMSATLRALERPGLERVLAIVAPNQSLKRDFEELPPAGHDLANCEVIRDWAFTRESENWNIPARVTCVGSGPFAYDAFVAFLKKQNIDGIPFESASEQRERPMPPTGELVLGRNDWDKETLDDIIDQHEGQSLRIYSQEMFIQALLCARDPFATAPDVLAAFRAGHPGLAFVSQGWAGWVHTNVPRNRRTPATMRTSTFARHEESPLIKMGYHVGSRGPRTVKRREILSQAFEDELPNVGTPEDMEEWGEPSSADRLRKIANHIASVCRNAKARTDPPEDAIRDWEEDLNWLKDKYYKGHMRFAWPSTEVS